MSLSLSSEPNHNNPTNHSKQINPKPQIEIDISSSVPAQYILGMVKSFTQIVSVDLAFVLQVSNGRGEGVDRGV